MWVPLVRISLPALIFTAASPVMAQSVEGLGDIPSGYLSSGATGVSDDGSVVVGNNSNLSSSEAFRWNQDGMVALGDFAGGIFESRANAVSADGLVIVGYGNNSSGQVAFRWTQADGMIPLGDLPGGYFSSQANAVNADGSVIVGLSRSANGFEAFRWVAGVMSGLGDLPGGSFESIANGVSTDGSVVVGYSSGANGYEAFRWTQADNQMVGLGDLAGGGFNSVANAVSADGSVVVGWGNSTNGVEAFRWTKTTGVMSGLGDLPGGTFYSQANAVSADGKVVVGWGQGTSGSEAFLWTQADGMKTVAEVLTAKGVDMTGWRLASANGVNSDGSIVVGNGSEGGHSGAFIAKLSEPTSSDSSGDSGDSGLITVEELAKSMTSAAVPTQQSQQAMTTGLAQSMFAASHVVMPAPQRHEVASADANFVPPLSKPSRWSAYAVGSAGNNRGDWSLNGTTGFMAEVSPGLRLGAGVVGGHGESDLHLDGESRINAAGGSIIAAYERPEGLRLYGSAFAAHLAVDTDRHYQNGAGIDSSSGSTDGIGYGAAVRGGWKFPVQSSLSVMPYAEFQWAETKLDGYTEQGGAFAAEYSDQTARRLTSRLGAEVEYQMTAALKLRPRLAWGHKLSGDDGSLTATTIGLTQVLSPVQEDSDWAEGGLTAEWQATDATALTAELAGRTGDTAEPSVSVMAGVSVAF